MFSIATPRTKFIFKMTLAVVSTSALIWFMSTQDLLPNLQTARALVPSFSGGSSDTGSSTELAMTGKYIVLDTVDMQVSLYEDDVLVGSYEILHAPDTNSPEYVSQGTYSIDKKTRTKLSTITMVRFPYFIQFGDTHALHATPQNAEGIELTDARMDGLIELSAWDAERVFAFAKEGMSVSVRTEKVLSTNSDLKKVDIMYDALPATSAEAYALTDLVTGQTLLTKNAGDKYPIASITKLVTALVATDVIGQGAQVLAPDEHYYTLSDLYYPLLLRSDNAVAEQIAEHAGETYFMSNMNAYVKALGMAQSSFSDSSGLSPKNISSAFDLSLLAHHLYYEKRFLLDITKEEDMSITSTDGESWDITNQNVLARDPHFRGGKLGYTDEAGQTSLSIFTVPVGKEVRPIAVVVLNSKDWKQDTRTLLRWLVETTK
ncbi:TPA: hypothetical protein DEP58_04345 [Patescibacteria group bacterium]|nr:MAG: D-alanyl-D-alanine carboxypeptidase [Parcubacteria group bacterium GW2011_GWD2_42_14]HCC05500.1 hypothetical protein [Patescibacteria group bacterium]